MNDPFLLLQNPLVLLFIVTSGTIVSFYIVYYTRKITDERKDLVDKMIFIVLGILFAISCVLVLFDHLLPISFIENGDVSNWATLVIEVGIGVIISLSILIYSDAQTRRISNILNANEKKNKERMKIMYKGVYRRLESNLRDLKEIHKIIASNINVEEKIEELKNYKSDFKDHAEYIDEITRLERTLLLIEDLKIFESAILNLKTVVTDIERFEQSGYIFPSLTMSKFAKDALEKCKNYAKIKMNEK